MNRARLGFCHLFMLGVRKIKRIVWSTTALMQPEERNTMVARRINYPGSEISRLSPTACLTKEKTKIEKGKGQCY